MTTQEMKIEIKPLADLVDADYNPRKALKPGDPEFERIARSIETFGYVDPIIVNKDGTIIGGHQRCAVMRSLGITEAKCVVVDFDKTKEKALNIALNKITGQWDGEKLKGLLFDLNSLGAAEDTGFSANELKAAIGNIDVTKISEARAAGKTPAALPTIEREISGGDEIDTSAFSDENFDCQCPRCGFRFNN